jgi:hypothetical protein
MTGPEHYQMAERLIDDLRHELWSGKRDELTKGYGAEVILARAQVHATLALAAANALNTEIPAKDWDAWYEAASEHAKADPA